ncbi:MAG: hypothetical protein ACJ8DK_24705, partial [Microvirga sp.]
TRQTAAVDHRAREPRIAEPPRRPAPEPRIVRSKAPPSAKAVRLAARPTARGLTAPAAREAQTAKRPRLARKHRSLAVVRLGPPPRLRGGFGATRYAYPLANGAGWVEERRFP